MKKQKDYSKLDTFLKSLVILFMCLLAFSFGVYTGKGLSDKQYDLAELESKTYKAEKFADAGDVDESKVTEDGEMAPEVAVSEEVSQAEIDEITQKALNAARAENKLETGEEQDLADVADVTKVREVAQVKETAKDTETASAVAEASPEMEEVKKMTSEAKEQKPIDSTAAAKVANNQAPVFKKVSTGPRLPSALPPTVGNRKISFTVQVASYPTEQDADMHAGRLKEKGFPAYPVKAVVNGQTWFRVSIGTFDSKKDALQYRKKLLEDSGIKTAFVQKLSN